MDAYRCPKCKTFLLSTYCGVCKDNISNLESNDIKDIDVPDFLRNLFKGK